ncbi:hypothetical protein [Bremerella sp.]|uniref:hypothetical protein n=1 Tax=Bremerella sp. TaxID=2795602 RepID=UPI00391DE84E
MESSESSTERPPFDPSRLHYQSWGSYVKTWVFQFTIRSFVVWISVICLVLGNIVTGAMLLRSQEELKRAERETGFLVYDDATKIHVTRVPVPVRGVWQFRVHLPEGRQYRLCHRVGQIPANGYPHTNPTSVYELPDTGELSFFLKFYETTHGYWDVHLEGTVKHPTERRRNGRIYRKVSLGTQERHDWIHAIQYKPSSSIREIAIDFRTNSPPRFFVVDVSEIPLASEAGHISFPADKTVELVRIRVANIKSPTQPPFPTVADYDELERSAEFPAEADGIMFWIEPVTESQSDGTS